MAGQIGQVRGLGDAGVALFGRPEAYLSNPAHLSDLKRPGLLTGFSGGASYDARPGMVRRDHPNPFWLSLSEATVMIPLGDGMGLALFGNNVFESRESKTDYGLNVPTGGPLIIDNLGGLRDGRSRGRVGGVAWGMKLGPQSALGLTAGFFTLRSVTYSAFTAFVDDYPAGGFHTRFSQNEEQRLSGQSAIVILGGRHKLGNQLGLGASVFWVAPVKFTSDYSFFSRELIEVKPNFFFSETERYTNSNIHLFLLCLSVSSQSFSSIQLFY